MIGKLVERMSGGRGCIDRPLFLHRKTSIFVKAHQRVTLAEEDFKIQVARMNCSMDYEFASFPSHSY